MNRNTRRLTSGQKTWLAIGMVAFFGVLGYLATYSVGVVLSVGVMLAFIGLVAFWLGRYYAARYR